MKLILNNFIPFFAFIDCSIWNNVTVIFFVYNTEDHFSSSFAVLLQWLSIISTIVNNFFRYIVLSTMYMFPRKHCIVYFTYFAKKKKNLQASSSTQLKKKITKIRQNVFIFWHAPIHILNKTFSNNSYFNVIFLFLYT